MKRRQFLAGTASLLSGAMVMASPQPQWRAMPRKRSPALTRGTARNVIFVLLEGGPSHVDMFDLKTGRDSPSLLGAQTMSGGFLWPTGILPKLATMTDKFSIVRSISAVEAVHERAVYHLFTAHRPNPALVEEIPSFEAVLSYKFAAQRGGGDSLPTVITMGQAAVNGLFPVDHRGLSLGERGRIENSVHEYEAPESRFGLLDGLLNEVRGYSDGRGDHLRIHDQARNLMNDPTLSQLFADTGEDEPETPAALFKNQCDVALRAIEANKGCRVFRLELNGWDHHEQIYSPNALPALAGALDEGLSYLISELENRPGQVGANLLEDTLIVAVGEFGRTVGGLNTSAGRDHYPYVVPALFAGGGVRGGRIIGGSDPQGAFINDLGWSHNRYMGIPDLMATVYSALGVDWTEQFRDTPSGRTFEIVDSGLSGQVFDIDPLFA